MKQRREQFRLIQIGERFTHEGVLWIKIKHRERHDVSKDSEINAHIISVESGEAMPEQGKAFFNETLVLVPDKK